MSRLLWRELREKWIWLLPLLASTVGTLLVGTGYLFLGDAHSHWYGVSAVVALLFGCSAHTSELAKGTADFAYSRPISWKAMLFAKVVSGLAIITAVVLLTAVICRLICPEPYVRFLALPYILPGIQLAMLMLGFAYLAGLACSVAMPGMLGSVTVLVLFWLLTVLEANITYSLGPHTVMRLGLNTMLVVAIVAALITARFGLTLPAWRRALRYYGVIAISIVAGIALNSFTKCDLFTESDYSFHSNWSLSSDGKYGFVQRYWSSPATRAQRCDAYMIDFAKGGKTGVSNLYTTSALADSFWFGRTLVAIDDDLVKYKRNRLQMTQVDESGHLHSSFVDFPKDTSALSLIPSPDHGWVAVESDPARTLLFVDVENARLVGKVHIDPRDSYWWQSNAVMAYRDRAESGEGELHLLQFGDSRGLRRQITRFK